MKEEFLRRKENTTHDTHFIPFFNTKKEEEEEEEQRKRYQ